MFLFRCSIMGKYCKPLTGKIIKKKLYSFDVETYGDKNKFLMGSIYDGQDYFVSWNLKKFRKKLLSLNDCIIFATNLSFDFLAVFGDDLELMSKFKLIVLHGNFIFVKYQKGNHKKIVFYDTLNFLRAPLKVLGEIIGSEKLPAPEFLGQFVKRCSGRGFDLQTYNKQDSYITYKFMEFMQDSLNNMGCNLKSTIPSCAMDLFRRKYLTEYLEQPDTESLKEMFKGYYGGRTECFIRGKIDNIPNLKLYDINGLYAYVMQKTEYPRTETLRYFDKENELFKKYEGLSFCEVIAPKNLSIPFLPFREPETKKLIFPVGKFSDFYAHCEIRKALELGYQIKILKTFYYTQTRKYFKSFIDDMNFKRQKYKKENNKLEIVYKLIQNSLYGKWAQSIYKQELLFYQNIKDNEKITSIFNDNWERETKKEPLRYEIDILKSDRTKTKEGYNETPLIVSMTDLETKKYPSFINPILSIYTTAYARIELYKYFEECLKDGYKVYYCDTDSIITDYEFKNISQDLGDLKIETEIKKGLLIKPKMYYVENGEGKYKIKAKGMRNLKDLPAFMAMIQTQKYEYTQFSKFKQSLRRKLAFNEKITVPKVLNLEDDKRSWEKVFNADELQYSEPIKI